MNREYHKWHSVNLDRTMEMLVFGHSGARVIVFPTRVGRFFDYENWGIVASVQEKIENGDIQLFCVDSVDEESFYCDWCHPSGRIQRHMQYERYILEEVLPFTQTKNPNQFLIAHGCSLGAYHALNIALRHPTIFDKAVSFSGRYNISTALGSYRDLFDHYYDENIYFNNPHHYLPNIHDSELLDKIRALEIIIVTGREDTLLQSNMELSQELHKQGICHQFHIWDEEAHRARYWRQMAYHYL